MHQKQNTCPQEFTHGLYTISMQMGQLQKSADSSCFVFFASSELVSTWVGVDPIVAAQCMCVEAELWRKARSQGRRGAVLAQKELPRFVFLFLRKNVPRAALSLIYYTG
mmetsp:Transcript_16877/g.30108  ORF Transcript_16877/g.30108 Transcript_16877/m.30108 type:complete len:109 (-) Transcript_16877:336-662(-)